MMGGALKKELPIWVSLSVGYKPVAFLWGGSYNLSILRSCHSSTTPNILTINASPDHEKLSAALANKD